MTRDDARFVETQMVAFAIYCDENDLSYQERIDLGEQIYDSFASAIEQPLLTD